MTSTLIQKLTGVRDLKKILETTVAELGESYRAEACQIMLENPLDPNLTSVCEYRASSDELTADLPCLRLPIILEGTKPGLVTLAWKEVVARETALEIATTITELSEIIRHAQINEIVQRTTFRDTFLVEIGNVMAYSLGIGDALFMVVNILGKVLHASRCLFICTDDTQTGWRCYEYCQQGDVTSLQDFLWPTTDSAVVAQTLLANSPLQIFEGQENSYISPVQEELQFIGAKSFLGIPLRSDTATHGCVILQQCDYRRSWTRQEVDMVQNVADKVAEALIKLPAEKLVREPIMQLHQRIVSGDTEKDKESIQAVRRSLKEALGQKAIPTARKTSQPAPPPAKAAEPVSFVPPASLAVEQASLAPPSSLTLPPPLAQPIAQAPAPSPETLPPPATPKVAPADIEGAKGQAGKSLGSILSGGKGAPSKPAHMPTFDFGSEAPAVSPEISQLPDSAPPPATQPLQPHWEPADAGSATEVQTPAGEIQPQIPPAVESAMPLPFQAMVDPMELEPHEDMAGKWGNLDAIPTPHGAPQGANGLSSAMFGKPKGPTAAAQSSSLLASLHKDKSKFTSEPQMEFIEGPPLQIDEAAAQAKLNQILSSSDPTSDFIFASKNLDVRVLGRIDGWIKEIEAKDKYKGGGHAKAVAEYAAAIAKQLGSAEKEIEDIRLAGILHDVGKLGEPAEVLQKNDDDLSDEELLLMMKHSLDGGDLLDSIPELSNLAQIVRSHHEEYDGNGYPAGLKGEEIPLAARIIRVADAYHAFTSDLTFRPAIKPEDAQMELTKGAGKQYDPRIVEALILCLMQKGRAGKVLSNTN